MKNIYDNLIKASDEFTEMCHPILEDWMSQVEMGRLNSIGTFDVLYHIDDYEYPHAHWLTFIYKSGYILGVGFYEDPSQGDKWRLMLNSIPDFVQVVIRLLRHELHGELQNVFQRCCSRN